MQSKSVWPAKSQCKWPLNFRAQYIKCWRQCLVCEAQRREYVAGIDLGTTNSCIAVTSGEDVEVISVEDDKFTIPSVVSYLGPDERIVGTPAKARGRKIPGDTYYSTKRFIGRTSDSIEQDADKVAYEICSGKDGFPAFRCSQTATGLVTPIDVASEILKSLIKAAEEDVNMPIQKAVVSVPAYFEDDQREATLQAAKVAGLQKVKLIKEPIAAALAYGVNIEKDQTVLVLDLGGGTFDVSILEIGDGVAEVLSSGGDSRLGGDDWDDAIVKWLASNTLAPAGISWREPAILSNLKTIAEIAKVKLSTQKQVVIRMPLQDKNGDPLQATLSQQEFVKISEPLFQRLQLPINACCWQAGVNLEDVVNESQRQKSAKSAKSKGGLLRPKKRPPISKVLLVGGATRMPIFRKFVQNMTGIEPDPSLVDPDLAVAIGATIHAGSLQEGESVFSHHEVMEPMKRALLNAYATQKLQADEDLAREMLGDDFNDFREGTQEAKPQKD